MLDIRDSMFISFLKISISVPYSRSKAVTYSGAKLCFKS